MIAELPTALILILGAALVPFVKGRVRAVYVLALPIAALAHVPGARRAPARGRPFQAPALAGRARGHP